MSRTALVDRFRPILYFIVAIWVLELINWLSGRTLTHWFGLEPRHIGGLIGVPAAPVLHNGWGHIAANTVPLAILAGLTLLTSPRRFALATLMIVLAGGLGTWIFARGGLHVGASGLIYGYFGFLLARGVIDRDWKSLAGAVVVGVLYSGLFWGVLPSSDHRISWEGHLFGALAGVAVAWWMRDRDQGLGRAS